MISIRGNAISRRFLQNHPEIPQVLSDATNLVAQNRPMANGGRKSAALEWRVSTSAGRGLTPSARLPALATCKVLSARGKSVPVRTSLSSTRHVPQSTQIRLRPTPEFRRRQAMADALDSPTRRWSWPSTELEICRIFDAIVPSSRNSTGSDHPWRHRALYPGIFDAFRSL